MSSAFSAQWIVRPALLAALMLGGACSSFQFGRSPSLPGSGANGAESEEIATPTPEFSSTERQRIALVQPWVDSAAYDYELEPQLINAVIWVESRFVERATSPAGAQGMMQLMPPTAGELAKALGENKASSYDPEFNITAGSLYLRKMIDRYDGDLHKALAAYNAGPGNVDKWTQRGRSLPPRSREYVQLVLDAKRRFEEHHDAILTHTDTMLAAAEPPREPASDPRPRPRPRARPRYVPEPPPAKVRPEPEPEPEPEPAVSKSPSQPAAKPAPPSPRPRGNAPARPALPSVLD